MVTRAIPLEQPATQAALAALGETEGVTSVRPLAGGRKVEVAYHLTHTGLREVEHRLAFLGLAPAYGLLGRLLRAVRLFREDNIRSQAKLVHHCCSAPPPRRR